MGFFSDLKEDLSQAVNELMPEEEQIKADNRSIDEMLENIDKISLPGQEADIPEQGTEENGEADVEQAAEQVAEDGGNLPDAEESTDMQETLTEEAAPVQAEEETAEEAPVDEDAEMQAMLSRMLEESPMEENRADAVREERKTVEQKTDNGGAERKMEVNTGREAVDETSVITAGMTITGDVVTEGSMDIIGTINGNIDALGKLNITGYINGNSKAAEVYAESAKINGEIVSEGAVKVGASAVIIGNITATSAAIAGAVKGDIDVKGPVILDASAIVMGNIKSKSVQINNGAVIEGMCSQCYADVSPTSFFDEYKPEGRKEKTK